MKAQSRKVFRIALALTLSLFAMPSAAAPCLAAGGDTVKVAYIDYNSFIEKTPDGSYTGYGADYLSRIAQYTGWAYEFVDMDWPTAYQAVKNGTVDFYCVARQTEERQADFDFSVFPICNEEMNLYTMPDREMYYEDFDTFNGMRVGMLEQSGEINYFDAYAKEHGFTYTLAEYPMNEDAVAALQSGEVDAIALVNYSVSDGFKLVGNFGVSPAYLMSCEGSPYMAEFSKAQERLYFDDPSFSQTLDQIYYAEANHDSAILLTRAEADYISSAGVMTVALSADMAPVEYCDAQSGDFRGVTVDLYRRISEMTGLQFRFTEREDVPILKTKMENGEIRLTGSLARSADVAEALSLTQTKVFSENSFMLVTKDVDALSQDSIIAVPAGYPQFISAAQRDGYTHINSFGNFEECVDAVYSGKADAAYIISMCEGYLLDRTQYTELRAFPCADANYGICLGVYTGADARLVSILNKCLSAVPTAEVNELIISNTSAAKPPVTLRDFVLRNGAALLAAAVLFVVLASFAVVRSQKARQQAALNKKLQKSHDFLQHLYDTLPCGIFQYGYEKPHKILHYNALCAKIYGYEDGRFPVVGEKPDAVVEAGTEEGFQKKFDECERTGPIMYVWPVTRKDGSQAYTESVMDLVDTDKGQVFQEVIIDVTERVLNEKLIESRYLQEINRSGSDEDLLYFACFDITDQVLVSTSIDVAGIAAGMSVAEFVEGLQFELRDTQTQAALEDFATRFSRERLQSDYDNGHLEQSFTLCRRHGSGRVSWVKSELALRVNPQNGHLMCFDYIRDITDEHVTNEITRSMALADCEALMNVYLPTGSCLQYEAVAGRDELKRSEAEYGKDDLLCVMAEQMNAADAEEFKRATALETVKEYLRDHDHYLVLSTLYLQSGTRSDKSVTFFYTNRLSGMLAVTVADVTEVRADEVRHARLLADALAAAEKADAAKSQFLSRVSHEMRTPLNAIIGFIELAKDADAEKIANYLASSDLAAKQLLSVINDVLDMSSIESGKMKIAYTSFNFSRMITSIANIYGTQCRQKNVAFEVVMETPTEEWLVGDELRINQILMNLLGNSIKFTSEGHIHLKLKQTNVDEEKVFLRFTVEDTGCGMSEEMKERLFKPFEQESASTAKKYGGSGLGLSIVKNLVGMMDGSIRVESAQGVGTAFIVDLPFSKSDVGQSLALPQTVDTLRILTVDDEPAEREYMSLVLTRMGIRYTSVCGGEEALAALKQSETEKDLYNVCLVDWRMPGMNGVETTKRIREKYGKELVVIVVSAYDFQQAGETAVEAGANLFLSKPIFQSSLFDLFMTLTGGKIAKPKDDAQAWDFAGKRVLLAEDNVLNQIVAKGYLAKYNVAVELAADGGKAVEMFASSPAGYYDAILMDIQMPVMDGYEAARAIRSSAHPEAKAIPIIAQTADAFNEDISRALAAGMNAHVSKPIKPDVLAKALHKAFTETYRH